MESTKVRRERRRSVAATSGTAPTERMSEGDFQEKMRLVLLELKGRIFDELAGHNREYRELAMQATTPDPVDNASQDVERRVLRSLGASEARRLQLIEAALARLRDGQYGRCLRCGRSIPRKRLQSIPDALYCLDCQSSEERRSR